MNIQIARSISRRAWLGAALLLAFAGCKGADYVPPASESEMVVQTKAMVNDYVSRAKAQPRAGQAEIDGLVESLEARVDQSGEGITGVLEAARELQALYQRSAPKAEINAQLQKLSEEADALGGASN